MPEIAAQYHAAYNRLKSWGIYRRKAVPGRLYSTYPDVLRCLQQHGVDPLVQGLGCGRRQLQSNRPPIPPVPNPLRAWMCPTLSSLLALSR